MKRWTLAAAIAVAAIVLASAAYLVLRPKPTEGILDTNGQVRGTEVTLSAKIAGIADIVAVRDGQLVRRGDLIAQIGSRELEARLAQAQAQAAAAQNLVAELDAQLIVFDTTTEQARLGAKVAAGTSSHEIHRATEALARANAEVAAAEAQAAQDRNTYERFEKLLAQGFVSRNYFNEVEARQLASEAKLKAARRAAEEARAGLAKARAASGEVTIKEKDMQRIAAERARFVAARTTAASRAEVTRARIAEVEAQLADLRIVAPAEGTVMAKLAEPGELVAAGRPIATLVNLEDLYVRVYVPEREIGKIRLGNPARISVDAFPGRVFDGEVSEVAQQAEFTPKEVHMKDEREKLVFGVKVQVLMSDGLLKPGMPADVRIKVDPNVPW